VDRALRHSVRDGMAYSVQVGAGETYFSAFALFLNATAAQVALLSTLPPLLGSSAQIFSAWLGTHFGRRRLVLWGCTLQALLWLPILLVPLLFAPFAIPALLVLLALYQGANNLSAPQWTSIMRDLVSERRRGRYFGYRTQVTTVTTFIALVICGVILDEVDKSGATYLGFVVIFAVAFVARTVSVYHLTFLYEPAQHGATPDMHIEHWWRSLLSTGAIGFSVYFALMNAAVGISSPFFTVYMLRDLKLSYLEFTALSGASVFAQYLMLSTWGRLADVYGNRLILIVTSVSLPVIPLLWLLSANFWWLLIFQVLVRVHAELGQPALRARAAHAASRVRRVPQRRHRRGRVRGRDARRVARDLAPAAQRVVRLDRRVQQLAVPLCALGPHASDPRDVARAPRA
jgi:MFS family permease